jgi:hypothetical protein
MADTTEAEARYIQRLPNQLMGALRKVRHYQTAHERYGMCLEVEAQRLLEEIYGGSDPLRRAEAEFQMARRA